MNLLQLLKSLPVRAVYATSNGEIVKGSVSAIFTEPCSHYSHNMRNIATSIAMNEVAANGFIVLPNFVDRVFDIEDELRFSDTD
jgi:hypothetical protein